MEWQKGLKHRGTETQRKARIAGKPELMENKGWWKEWVMEEWVMEAFCTLCLCASVFQKRSLVL